MEEIKFIVYEHVNKINNKKYVGITSQDPEKRWRKGFGYIACTCFYRAIKKYGWNNFEHNILYTGLSNSDALDIEIKLIKENQSIGMSYNIRDDSSWVGKSRSHKVKVYTIDGQYIDTCDSIHAASKQFNVSESGIYYSAIKFRNTRYWKNYIFIFEDEKIEDRLNYIHNFKYKEAPNKKRVIMKDALGNVVKIFQSLIEASEYIKAKSIGSLALCCQGKRKSYYGYKWEYEL